MKIQLWSYNYDPEPTGIGPLSTVWARAMSERGHQIEVVAAHPHYPEPIWGRPVPPRRELRDGISVIRLPLWPGRGSTAQRLRQELTFTTALACAAPLLGTPDVIVAVSPSFPALAPTMAAARVRRVPWVLWLQDILPDGATATGLLGEGRLIGALRRFELAAYRSASRVVVISNSFATNLLSKGVPPERIVRIFNPASLPVQPADALGDRDERLVLTMGNIGHTQNLVHVTRAFEASAELAGLNARFVLAGDGVCGDDVRAAITSDRVQVTGVVDRATLEGYLRRASVAIVSQEYQGLDFNVPSKLMNFMAYGLPTLAAVRPDSEVARIVGESGAGWVTNGSDPDEFAERLVQALTDPADRLARAERGLAFAQENFTPEAIASQFEGVLDEVVSGRDARRI
ncbi:MAG: colanic acid biosynthesis glycosyl transferase WcaI [Solirubrobacteraceae bacterium]|jgi:colanic acid biosynthesis glycosyl transferase WcaI|nr:colanic acid biosynthesis glycosyl transferase WcaI [Solirubrobacteraceae bacterium]